MALEQNAVTACVLSRALGEAVLFKYNNAAWVAVGMIPIPYRMWIILLCSALHGTAKLHKDALHKSNLGAQIAHLQGIVNSMVSLNPGTQERDSLDDALRAVREMFRKMHADQDPAGRIVSMLQRMEDEHSSIMADAD